MKIRSVAGVLAGGVIDILATNIFAIPVVVYLIVREHPVGADGLTRALAADPTLGATMMALGALASVLGGYAAAWIAGRNRLLVGALSAYLCVASGIVALAHGIPGVSLMQHLGGLVLSPALGLLGGYLRLLQSRHVARA